MWRGRTQRWARSCCVQRTQSTWCLRIMWSDDIADFLEKRRSGVGARREVVGTRLTRLVPTVTRNVSLCNARTTNLPNVLVPALVDSKPTFHTFYYPGTSCSTKIQTSSAIVPHKSIEILISEIRDLRLSSESRRQKPEAKSSPVPPSCKPHKWACSSTTKARAPQEP